MPAKIEMLDILREKKTPEEKVHRAIETASCKVLLLADSPSRCSQLQ